LSDLDTSDDMREVFEYTLSAPGKRIRSVLILWCSELFTSTLNPNAEIAAVAMEMVHTCSLVHDDLPAMDNDDLRRGWPTCHKAFDEATAILAGDALLTAAFEVIAEGVDDSVMAVRLIRELARAAGPGAMIAGQMADLKAEQTGGDMATLQYIHTHKTARMFQCAATMGGICGGASEDDLHRLADYGLKIGLGFQIADDILDVCGTSDQLGKTAGKDERAGKLTYPSLIGLDQARALAQDIARDAVASLDTFGEKADILRQLASALLNRKK
jgi:geranylgeranyl diphosphate synthase type II